MSSTLNACGRGPACGLGLLAPACEEGRSDGAAFVPVPVGAAARPVDSGSDTGGTGDRSRGLWQRPRALLLQGLLHGRTTGTDGRAALAPASFQEKEA